MFYKMSYSKGQYTIERVKHSDHFLDPTKVDEEVRKIGSGKWVSTNKDNLRVFAEEHKQNKLRELNAKMMVIQLGGVVFA